MWAVFGGRIRLDWSFLFFPLRSSIASFSEQAFFFSQQFFNWLLPLALPFTLLVAFILGFLSFRRAASAKVNPWIATAAVVPIIQLGALVFLCIVPEREVDPNRNSASIKRDERNLIVAMQGMVAGVALTVVCVAVGALIFGEYGYAMFAVSPFFIGAMTGFLANRKGDIGPNDTVLVAMGAVVLGGVALIVVALEGVICLVLAFPLTVGFAVLGGVMGRASAVYMQRPRKVFVALALVPSAFVTEQLFPPFVHFDAVQEVDINAGPSDVWHSIVQMPPIESQPSPLFRLGIAYPKGGEFMGEGVGAMRRGDFSTGTATERVSEWELNRKLTLDVLNDPPAMRELSPYEHVHAPHVIGYFVTQSMSFEIESLTAKRVRLVERTSHELKIDPVFYWLPMARYMVHENNARVLAHIKQQSERIAAAAR